MDEPLLLDILNTRLAVGALGERTTPPWWRTQVLTEAGSRMTARLFPRTALRASLETVTLAAAGEHDPHVGPHRFHLFRLPAALENRLQDLLAANAELTAPQDLEPGETPAEGPRSLGPVSALRQQLPHLKALYAAAAASGRRVYPYFEP